VSITFQPSGPKSISIFNIKGKLVKRFDGMHGTVEWSTQAIPGGVYTIKAVAANRSATGIVVL
jgi:hypothetical protein